MIPGNNWTGHICVLPFVIRDSYTLSDWNSFWNQLKNKKLQANNYYNCKNQIFHFIVSMFFFFCLKRLSWLSNSSPANAGNCILESSILEISWGNMLPGTAPPPSPAPAAQTVQVCQLNLCFQTLLKTLH